MKKEGNSRIEVFKHKALVEKSREYRMKTSKLIEFPSAVLFPVSRTEHTFARNSMKNMSKIMTCPHT